MDSLTKKKGLYGFIQVLSSNFILILLGIVSTFIVPGHVTPSEFGYWQTYLLYAAYVGLAIFGYCDGIYLRYGGKKYENLPKKKFATLFYIMLLYLAGLSMLASAVIFFYDIDNKSKFIFVGVILSMILRCLVSFFILINQATARFKIYSIGNTIEKTVFVIFVIICVLFSNISMYSLIVISLLAQLCSLAYNIYYSADLIIPSMDFSRSTFIEIKLNILAGLPLTMYGISSMLMTGIGKFAVEHYLGKEQFGYYSFSFPMMAVISYVISSASLVLFPLLRQTSAHGIKEFYKFSNKWSLPLLLLIMLSYLPIRFIVKYFLTAYMAALPCLFILLPMIFFQTMITMVYNTILKVQRRERTMMLVSFIAVAICAAATIIIMHISPSLNGVAIATTMSYLLWSLILKYRIKTLSKKGWEM